MSVSFGDASVLDGAQFTLDVRERVCLLGRNGEGKSTLMRIISGEIVPDRGETERAPNLRVAKLDQEVPETRDGSVFDIVAEALGEQQQLIREYHHATQLIGEFPDDTAIAERFDELQRQLDTTGGWAFEQQVVTAITRVGLDGDVLFNSLSGGQKRRVLIARALVNDPHILLLDEPTNHLDLNSIAWLEEFLLRLDKTLLFVTHDRAFLRKLATRILDLDRGRLTSHDCSYEVYLERKAELLENEAKHQATFDKKLAQEEVWIRQGVKARRTRNEGRVRALEKLRSIRSERRNVQGNARLEMQSSELSGAKVVRLENVSYAWGDNPIIQNFSTTLWRGDKIGIIGPNGSGKTTLLHLLLGKLKPQQGTVTHGTQLEIAYFDQLRGELDPKRTLAENVSPNSDVVTFNGKSRHIISYLRDFLFSPEDARAPINRLSGGERARVLLARLFLRPTNVLVMDEPTNDLDIQTIELLEDLLLNYPGTLLLVSHDRDFLDNVVNASIVLDGKGTINEYVGTYFQDNKTGDTQSPVSKLESRTPPPAKANEIKSQARKLSNKERDTLKKLPVLIEQMEAEHTELTAGIGSPAFHAKTGKSPAQVAAQIEALETKLKQSYAQWEELEALNG